MGTESRAGVYFEDKEERKNIFKKPTKKYLCTFRTRIWAKNWFLIISRWQIECSLRIYCVSIVIQYIILPVCFISYALLRESKPIQVTTITHAHWKGWYSSISHPPTSSTSSVKSAFVHIYAWLVSHIDAHLCLSSTWQLFFSSER